MQAHRILGRDVNACDADRQKRIVLGESRQLQQDQRATQEFYCVHGMG